MFKTKQETIKDRIFKQHKDWNISYTIKQGKKIITASKNGDNRILNITKIKHKI